MTPSIDRAVALEDGALEDGGCCDICESQCRGFVGRQTQRMKS
jgi:hypothetical protein